jgi:hypothetical protein
MRVVGEKQPPPGAGLFRFHSRNNCSLLHDSSCSTVALPGQ